LNFDRILGVRLFLCPRRRAGVRDGHGVIFCYTALTFYALGVGLSLDDAVDVGGFLDTWVEESADAIAAEEAVEVSHFEG